VKSSISLARRHRQQHPEGGHIDGESVLGGQGMASARVLSTPSGPSR
jgi:hypothetical protein